MNKRRHNNQELLRNYLNLSISDPHQATVMFSVINNWIHNHGLEWTIAHCKAIKTVYLKHLSGCVDYSDTSVRMKNGMPVGIFSILWKEKPDVSLRIINVYTIFTLPSVTKKQHADVVQSVNVQSQNVNGMFIRPFCGELNKVNICLQDVDLDPLAWFTSSEKRTVIPSQGGLHKVSESDIPLEMVIKYTCLNHANKQFVIRHQELIYTMFRVPKRMNSITTHIGASFPFGRTTQIPYLIGGELSFIQERGGKCRHIANPLRLFQAMCTPFGKFMEKVLKEDDMNHCIFDQEKGVTYVKDLMRKGLKVHSVDLSKATDRFPLSIQVNGLMDLLSVNQINLSQNAHNPLGTSGISFRAAYPSGDGVKDSYDYLLRLRDWLSVYDYQYPPDETRGMIERSFIAWLELATSHWVDRHGPPLMWKTGQPLGLYPSFFAFTYTHVQLLRLLCLQNDVPFHSFMVLGDDVVIGDTKLYEKYRDVLAFLDVPVSESKTFCSYVLGEFAGKIVYEQQVLKSSVKFQGFSQRNPLGPLRVFGRKGLVFVPKRYKRIIKLLSSLPEPYGLGLNPEGIPLIVRLEGILDNMGPYTVRPLRYNGMPNRKMRQRTLDRFFSRKGADLSEFIKFRQDLDEDIVKEFNATARHHNSWDEYLPLILQINIPSDPTRSWRDGSPIPLKQGLRYIKHLQAYLKNK